jgi:hypothetical protein
MAGFFAERMSSYLGFNEFRTSWARLLGFDLDDMQRFGGLKPWTTEPLQCFFDHSDCDGDISRQDAEQILVEARKDALKLPDYDSAFSVLIRACETAVAKKLPISSCVQIPSGTPLSAEPKRFASSWKVLRTCQKSL